MSGLGTDVLAVACIMGGAAVSGGATLAALRDGPPPRCETEAIVIPRVSVRTHATGVVVRPRVVRVETGSGCAAVVVGNDVQIRLDEARERVEAARVRVERARVRVEAARERAEVMRARAEEMRVRAEAVGEELERVRVRTEIPADEIRARLQEELVRLEEELARRGGGVEGR